MLAPPGTKGSSTFVKIMGDSEVPGATIFAPRQIISAPTSAGSVEELPPVVFGSMRTIVPGSIRNTAGASTKVRFSRI